MGDIISISGLALKVYITYKDAGDEYSHILEEVVTLQVLVDKVTQHLKGTTVSSNDRHEALTVLKGYQGVLEELNSLIQKHKRLAFINKKLALRGVKLGKEDIETLHLKLISNTGLLNGFV